MVAKESPRIVDVSKESLKMSIVASVPSLANGDGDGSDAILCVSAILSRVVSVRSDSYCIIMGGVVLNI